MSRGKIIKGNFGPRPMAGNPNPGDPRQPSPPTFQELGKPKPPIQGPTWPGHPKMPWEDVDMSVGPDESVDLTQVNGDPLPVTADQHKAIGLILSGMPYICIGIKPTATGCDFFTAMEGPETDLRNCYDDLPGVLQRLYKRKNLL